MVFNEERLQYKIGDCIEILKAFPENHFDSCVTDPPYGLEFMGEEWDTFDKALMHQRDMPKGTYMDTPKPRYRAGKDFQSWTMLWASEVLRVLKPGGYLLAFGGTRTSHRLACAIEDAGFEIRDMIIWLYGSGFPKSMDISKAIDKCFGAEREVVGVKPGHENFIGRETHPLNSGWDRPWAKDPEAVERYHSQTAPSTPEAKQWAGWGTALKPAYEPIFVARKPIEGTVADNVLKHGVGGLNIDGCRIPAEERKVGITLGPGIETKVAYGNGINSRPIDWQESTLGRFPANLILDEESAKAVDEESGDCGGGTSDLKIHKSPNLGRHGIYGHSDIAESRLYTDSGGASRFFYIAKASRAERDRGLEGLLFKENDRTNPNWRCKKCGLLQFDGQASPICECESPEWERHMTKNFHPTVKPIKLMQYLVRMVTPPNGLVLDPFLGSGTTLIACQLEGMRGVGIEKESEYEPIIKGRLAVDWSKEERIDSAVRAVIEDPKMKRLEEF